MPGIMSEKTKKEVQKILRALPGQVTLLFFTKKKDCQYCERQHDILKTISSMSKHLALKVFDLERDTEQAEQYHVDKVPATIVQGDIDHGIRFFGLTAGHEFSSLIQAITMVSGRTSGLQPDLEALIKEVTIPVHLEVMTTLTCPYCPQAVHAAHQLALINDNITADMVESGEFRELTAAYDVTNTPKTMINGTYSFVGAIPVQAVFMEIIKHVDPKRYDELQAMIHEAHGERQVRKAETDTIYDTIIAGGGPAAMSAAIYAARKQLNVLLISKDIGGQITYTASINNYIGMPAVHGRDLKDQFLFHMESYPIAESIGALVTRIEQVQHGFTVKTDTGRQFKGKSVIFCTGKEYNRLGIPGEEKYLGHGIAFCATCDAPLYRDKIVAVVGGANSAFTAVRDLIGYAKTIHLVHHRTEYKADPALIDEIKKASNVKFHINTTVEEFLGREKLTGIRIHSSDTKLAQKLQVDGVFLEIGLSPNTGAVSDLIQLNDKGEIPISAVNTTAVPGFFAAGDATDVRDKQIVVAAGEGAKAALSAYEYLIAEKLIEPTLNSDNW